MAILYETKTWRRERPATAREPDLTPDQIANVKRAAAFLRVRLGGLRALAKAARLAYATLARASNKVSGVSVRTALRVARAAGVPLEDVLSGRFPPQGACPHCGRT